MLMTMVMSIDCEDDEDDNDNGVFVCSGPDDDDDNNGDEIHDDSSFILARTTPFAITASSPRRPAMRPGIASRANPCNCESIAAAYCRPRLLP